MIIDTQKVEESFHTVIYDLTVQEQIYLIELLAKNIRDFE